MFLCKIDFQINVKSLHYRTNKIKYTLSVTIGVVVLLYRSSLFISISKKKLSEPVYARTLSNPKNPESNFQIKGSVWEKIGADNILNV